MESPIRSFPSSALQGTTSPHHARKMAGKHGLSDGEELELPEQNPQCQCEGNPIAVRRVSNTNKNPNRPFWVCSKPRDSGDRCAYFQWEDEMQAGEQRHRGSEASPGGTAKRPRTSPARTRGDESSSGRNRPNIVTLSLKEIDSVSAVLQPGKISEALEKELMNLRGVSAREVGPRPVVAGCPRMKNFVIPIVELEMAKRLAAASGCCFELDVPSAVIERLQEFQQVEAHRRLTRKEVTQGLDEILPLSMCEKLMEFQWEGIHFALRRGGRCLIGDDMGLGKTLQAIAVARVFRDDWPLLIICPSSLRLNWKEELLSWLGEDIDEDDINVMMKGTDCARRFALVNIASYELVQKVPEREIRKCRFVIADESHYVKSRDTKRSQFVTPLIKKVPRALLLSGTPALSRPVELFPQVNALEPKLFPSYNDFTERYCAARMGPWGWDVSGSSNLGELHVILRGSCLIRRKKEDVLTQLPSKQRGVVWVETTPKVMKLVKRAQGRFDEANAALQAASSADDALRCRNAVRGAQNDLYSLTGQAKIVATQQFLKEVLDSMPAGKILVFGHHSDVLSQLDEFVRKKMKMETIMIDGQTPQHLRQGLCKQFQTQSKTRVAMLSITAAGVGLTLTAATVVVFAELYWTPGSLMQAEDRAHRIGQKDCVMVKYLLARDTLDETIWEAVKNKLKIVDQSLTGKSSNLSVANEAVKAPTAGGIEKFLTRSVVEVIDDDDDAICTGSYDAKKEEQRGDDVGNRLGPSPGRVLCDGTIALDDEDDIFPTEITIVDNDSVSRPRRSVIHLDADLALAKRLQTEFDAEMSSSL